MKKFWNWMERMGHGKTIAEPDKPVGSSCIYYLRIGVDWRLDYTEQMLGFYMIEYLFKIYPECIDRPTFWDTFKSKDINRVYDYLKERIEKAP